MMKLLFRLNNNIKINTMKTINILKIVAVFLFVGMFTACVQDDDYTVPSDLGVIENVELSALLNSSFQEKTIQQVKDLFVAGEVNEITSDIYVKGYVVSSDETGNFYKEFYIQDSPSNPTAAIKVMLNVSDAFGKYNLGREVYINLKDLYVGEANSGDGVIAIGWAVDFASTELEEIAEARSVVQILRANVTMQITPLPVSFTQINNNHIGMFVSIDNAQFPLNIAGSASYVSSLDDFDTTLTIEACEGFGYANFKLETSTFANFKDVTIPADAGTIAGIVSRDYDGSNMVLALNSIDDVNMNAARCMPLDINDFTNIFSEDFEGMTNNSDVTGNGWTNFAEVGFNNWRVSTTNDSGNPGSKMAKMSAYNSNDNSNVSWLISPSIDLDAQSLEFVTFQTSNSFSDNSELEVLISTDWDGNQANITTSNWITLPAAIVGDSEFYQNWIGSGSIDLSLYTGTAYIAFKYTGGDDNTDQTGTYELDDFNVLVQ